MSSLPVIRIAFSDFWLSFAPQRNFFTTLLSEKFTLDIKTNPEEADFLVYSCFGNKHKGFKGIKIYYTGESRWPNYAECDYAFTFYKEETERHSRLPYFLLGGERLLNQLKDRGGIITPSPGKNNFCNFVYSNPRCGKRNRFFHTLSKYKHIDSGGRFMNNIGGPVPDKMDFISRYKFSIAFENSASRGYLTEKILEPLVAGSLPIYWGDPDVALEFNPARFLHYRDFSSEKDLIDCIIELDNNEEEYQKYFTAPLFMQENIVENYRKHLLDKFEGIFTHGKILRQPSRKLYYMGKKILVGKKMFPYFGK